MRKEETRLSVKKIECGVVALGRHLKRQVLQNQVWIFVHASLIGRVAVRYQVRGLCQTRTEALEVEPE
jgi:hypothetical protein